MRIVFLILGLILISCKEQKKEGNQIKKQYFEKIKTADFDLIKTENQKGLLILFPCYSCDAENTLSEFEILEVSIKNGFSILAMNLNQHLFLNQSEKQKLANQLEQIVLKNSLSKENIFIGGFSSGGNISLLISNYLVESKSLVQPKGVFVVDAPIDLLALYKIAQKELRINSSAPLAEEAIWIKNFFDEELGNPENGIESYEKYSPFTFETQNIKNLKNLKNLRIRFYTEPDLKWWKQNRKNDYEDLNAYYLKKLSEKLKNDFGNKNIELIETEGRGYRISGERHPHSWSIVDAKDLMEWMIQ